jgi:hypothetical protein
MDEDESRSLQTALDQAMRFGETQYVRGLVAAFAALLLALDSRRVLAIADTRRMLQDIRHDLVIAPSILHPFLVRRTAVVEQTWRDHQCG